MTPPTTGLHGLRPRVPKVQDADPDTDTDMYLEMRTFMSHVPTCDTGTLSAITAHTQQFITAVPPQIEPEARVAIARQVPLIRHAGKEATKGLPTDEAASVKKHSNSLMKSANTHKVHQHYVDFLDRAWGSREAWLPSSYCKAQNSRGETPGNNIISYIRRITQSALHHQIPLASLWADGGVLRDAANKRNPPKIIAKILAEASKAYEEQYPIPKRGRTARSVGDTAEHEPEAPETPEVARSTRDMAEQTPEAPETLEERGPEPDTPATGQANPQSTTPTRPPPDNSNSLELSPQLALGANSSVVASESFDDTQDPFPVLITNDDDDGKMIAESLPLSSDSSDSFEVLDLGPSVDQRVRRRGTIYSSNVHVLGSDDSPHGSPAAAHARPQVWAPADGMSNAALQLASSDAMLQGDTLWILVKAISSHAQHLLTSRSIQIIDPLGIEIPTSGETRSRLHRLQQFRTTLTYVHHATDHWSLAQVTVHRNENDGLRIRVSHYDSASQVAATDRVRKAFSSIVSQEAPGSSFEFEAMECPQQEDCYSCGIFATVFLTHLIHGTEMPHSIDPQQERRQFQKLLGDFERQTADASNASIDLTRKSLDKVTGGSHARPDEKSRS
ncbi:uncharacterized protein GLRG_11692, partial [Colletotrichum graminicola M1.001]